MLDLGYPMMLRLRVGLNGNVLLDYVAPDEALAEGEVLPDFSLRDEMLLLLWAFETPNDDTQGSDRY